MPTSVTVNDLKINELTEAQYDAAVQGGVIGENELSVITDMTDKAVQVSTMPTASATELDNIYQFTGTTDANYTNGYFYKCVSDGQQPATYSWTAVEVQASSGGLPSQAGNAGKFLTTDGTDASWGSEVKPFVIKSTTATTFDEILVLKSSDEIAEYNTHISHGHYGGLYITESSFNNGWVISNASIKPYKNTAGSIGIYNGHVETVYANYLSSATSYAESTTNRISVPNTSGTMVVATPPSADGTYVLKATVADGVVTTAWVAE